MHIVTGMHRSGTSFLAQALDALGAEFGDPEKFFPADRWNQRGYFEALDLIDVNNRAILGLNARLENWTEAPESGIARFVNAFISMKWKYFLFPGRVGIEARLARQSDRVAGLHARYQQKFVKDPRFCLTIGGWATAGPVESLIFSFRRPAAVAASVRRREGLPLALGYSNWLYHVRAFFEAAPRDVPLLLVDFDQFFDPARQQAAFQRLARHMDRAPEDPVVSGLAQTLDIQLAKQQQVDFQPPARVTRVYDALRALHVRCEHAPIILADHDDLIAGVTTR